MEVKMVELRLSNDIRTVYSRQATEKLGSNYWYVANDVDVVIRTMGHEYAFSIPCGYLTDGATVPRVIWNIIPVWDECSESVVIHDYLCNYPRVKLDGCDHQIPREVVDRLFLAALEFYGVNKLKRFLMYNAVSLYTRAVGSNLPPYWNTKVALEKAIRENIQEGYK